SGSSPEQPFDTVDPELRAASQARGLPVLRPVQVIQLGRREIAARALSIARANSSEAALSANVTFLRMLGLVPDGFEWEQAARDLFELHLAGLYDASASQVLITDGRAS